MGVVPIDDSREASFDLRLLISSSCDLAAESSFCWYVSSMRRLCFAKASPIPSTSSDIEFPVSDFLFFLLNAATFVEWMDTDPGVAELRDDMHRARVSQAVFGQMVEVSLRGDSVEDMTREELVERVHQLNLLVLSTNFRIQLLEDAIRCDKAQLKALLHNKNMPVVVQYRIPVVLDC